MMNIEIKSVLHSDGAIREHVYITDATGGVTTMLKSVWDELQAQQVQPPLS